MKNTQNTDYVAVIPFYEYLKKEDYLINRYLLYNISFINSNKEDDVHKSRINMSTYRNIHEHSPIWLIVSTEKFDDSIVATYNYDNFYPAFNNICKSGLLQALKANKANRNLIKHILNNKPLYIQTLVEYEKS